MVLPGQGAFKSCMDGLDNINGMIKLIRKKCYKKQKTFFRYLCWNATSCPSGL